MSALRTALLAAALLPLASPALAAKDEGEKWETSFIADKPLPVVLKPDRGYILLKANYQIMPMLMRQPSEQDKADHARRRADALAEEHADWVKKFAAWQREMKSLERSPASLRRPKRPQEPTEANFGFPEYQQVHTVTMGPQNRFSKEGASVYLQEVPPGEYVFYSSMNLCACLGTVSFEVPAGKIVPVQFALPFLDAMRDTPKETRPKTAFDLPPGTTTLRLGAAEVSDPRLPAGSIIAPVFKPAGRRPNWFGLEADRLMAIEGVFTYDRDQQVSVAAKAAEAPAAQ